MVLGWISRLVSKLECVNCGSAGLRLSSTLPDEGEDLPPHGYIVCDNCNTLYPIAEGIADMMPRQTRPALTMAGWSNHFAPAPQVYERIWRRRALTLLTNERFSVEREWGWLNEWTNVQAGEFVIDLGTSTGLYARGLSGKGATIIGVDAAWGMLSEAKKYVEREKRKGIVLMRATAEHLPFRDWSMDAVVVGGSLNEMKSIGAALGEAKRVTRRGGRMFVMSLSKARENPGRLVQDFLGASGIQFPAVNVFNAMAQKAGWEIQRQELRGVVLFSLMGRGSEG